MSLEITLWQCVDPNLFIRKGHPIPRLILSCKTIWGTSESSIWKQTIKP